MMGHISGAYAARVSRDLSLCTRFDFNVYSYESEWTMGAEWWLRRGLAMDIDQLDNSQEFTESISRLGGDDVQGVVKARISTNTVSVVRNVDSFSVKMRF